MAKLSPDAKDFYEPHFTFFSWAFALCTTIPLDIFKFLLDFIPGVDLGDILISIAALLSINLYFFIKLGPSYLGGKKSNQKWFIVIATWILGLIPLLDGIDFDETIDAVGIMLTVTSEDKLLAEEKAPEAANDAFNQQALVVTHQQAVQQIQEENARQQTQSRRAA